MAEQRSGIRILPVTEKQDAKGRFYREVLSQEDIWKASQGLGFSTVKFVLETGLLDKRGGWFVRTTPIVERLREKGFPEGRLVGWIKVSFNPAKKILSFNFLEPPIRWTAFRDIGLGLEAETRILKELARICPDYRVRIQNKGNKAKVLQLKARGHRFWRTIPIHVAAIRAENMAMERRKRFGTPLLAEKQRVKARVGKRQAIKISQRQKLRALAR